MKCLVFVVLSYAVASNAYPSLLPVIGNVGKNIGSGIGGGVGLGIGTAVNVGAKKAEHLGAKVVGAGLGVLDFGSGLAIGLGTGVANGLRSGLSLVGIKGRNIKGDKYDKQRNPGLSGHGPYPDGPGRNMYPGDGPYRSRPRRNVYLKRNVQPYKKQYRSTEKRSEDLNQSDSPSNESYASVSVSG